MQSIVLWVSVVATMYGGVGSCYDEQPLYCAGPEGPFYSERTAPWVAVDVREFESGRVRCGDVLEVRFPDGEVLIAQALDAGPFARYWVPDWPELPIAVDVPAHLWQRDGLAAVVDVVNVSAKERMDAAGRPGLYEGRRPEGLGIYGLHASTRARQRDSDAGNARHGRRDGPDSEAVADPLTAEQRVCEAIFDQVAGPDLLHQMPGMATTPARTSWDGLLLSLWDQGPRGLMRAAGW